MFKYPLEKQFDGEAILPSSEKIVAPTSENNVAPESGTYKDKLLNLFGEVASQKLKNLNHNLVMWVNFKVLESNLQRKWPKKGTIKVA